MRTYPLVDAPTAAECELLNVSPRNAAAIVAISSGEKRPPRAGEWYLSGAIVEAYRAPNDLAAAYHIARLVVVSPNEQEPRS